LGEPDPAAAESSLTRHNLAMAWNFLAIPSTFRYFGYQARCSEEETAAGGIRAALNDLPRGEG
jgi:hypothetical protein